MSSTPPAAPGQLIELQIERIAATGQGIALLQGIPVFIPRGIPGQRLQVTITKVKDRYMEAKVLKVLGTAPGEVKPRCKHFASCGGCVWQHLPYEKQIVAKEDIVRETLEHVTPVDEKIRKSLPGRRKLPVYRVKRRLRGWSSRLWCRPHPRWL
ncbi:MAG: TRAM domain-containing protein [Patescibacteria group bacterium]